MKRSFCFVVLTFFLFLRLDLYAYRPSEGYQLKSQKRFDFRHHPSHPSALLDFTISDAQIVTLFGMLDPNLSDLEDAFDLYAQGKLRKLGGSLCHFQIVQIPCNYSIRFRKIVRTHPEL